MTKKKVMLLMISLVLGLSLFIPLVHAFENSATLYEMDATYNISTDSNFFGEVENTTPVEIDLDFENTLDVLGYDKIAETDSLILYLKERNFNIAVHDKVSGYTWYSIYPKYRELGLTGTSLYFLESGVTIEYFNMDNILIDSQKSYLSGSKYNVDITYDYESVENGVLAHLNFEDLAIEFDVEVYVEEGSLKVRLPIDSLVEGQIEKTVLNIDGTTSVKVTQNRIKAVYLFPYFGSNTYEINGYSMIPDGSGALIRYTNIRSSTAYTKRIYGSDEGLLNFNPDSSTYYLQDELTASLPVFGVNHGYNQAAFLAVIEDGDAFAEIDSYPYGYNSYYLNTTFFKFILRERYTIQTSSSANDSFKLINDSVYPTDYCVGYYFLANEDASYSGMALKYKNLLALENRNKAISKLNLSFIGMDYKSGLFGKDFVVMTDYQDVCDIASELAELGVENLDIVYIGWSKGGYYDNTPVKAVVSGKLGGKSDFIDMMNTLTTLGVDISFYDDPLISFSDSLGNGVVKKITLKTFETDFVRSSLFESSYFKDPMDISETILHQQARFSKLSITSIALGSVGSALYSYRSNSANHYRQEVIQILQDELTNLQDYEIGLYQPNAYLWNLIDKYYEAPIESNKYAYITDSIPFVELVLSGTVEMTSPYINYVSDYNLFSLRLVEYGITPSFLITQESTHMLRYTNFAYVYTSEYDLWKSVINDIVSQVSPAFEAIGDHILVNHRYIIDGVAEATYDNGMKIYVNYTNEVQVVAIGIAVAPNSFRVVMPS